MPSCAGSGAAAPWCDPGGAQSQRWVSPPPLRPQGCPKGTSCVPSPCSPREGAAGAGSGDGDREHCLSGGSLNPGISPSPLSPLPGAFFPREGKPSSLADETQPHERPPRAPLCPLIPANCRWLGSCPAPCRCLKERRASMPRKPPASSPGTSCGRRCPRTCSVSPGHGARHGPGGFSQRDSPAPAPGPVILGSIS